MVYEARTTLKKLAKMDGYRAESYSPRAFVKHLAYKFGLSEFEAYNYHKKGKIRVIYIG